MQGFNRRGFLKTVGISTVVMGLSSVAALKRGHAEDVDWFQNINRVKDPLNKTPKEKGHAPVINWPINIKSGEPFTVDIQVGENLHPMTANHYIQWIEVYLGTEQVVRTEFSPSCPQAKITIPIVLKESAALRVVTRCNLHGIWDSVKTIAV